MEWISVKERLPEIDFNVLVYSRGRDLVYITYRLDEYYPDSIDDENKIVWDDQGIFNSITHWMPLPAKPKTEEE